MQVPPLLLSKKRWHLHHIKLPHVEVTAVVTTVLHNVHIANSFLL